MTFKAPIFYTILAWLTTTLVYIVCGLTNGEVWVIPQSFVDKAIPFNASGIWLYLSFYIYIPYTFFMVDYVLLKQLSLAFIVTSLLSAIVFILLPSSIEYPHIIDDGFSSQTLSFVSRHDTDRNCFPSLCKLPQK